MQLYNAIWSIKYSISEFPDQGIILESNLANLMLLTTSFKHPEGPSQGP